ncbi:RidA family protein [Halorubellus sp. JP-L1]|uniref:RidA family protein n=1 Tax=Halorubellus sp. JP-L1 TaxID=2715753 RepID=UPI00140D00FE|nr:RidA family protein [Halorubellus sp. JP-L1]NHN43102.1 RidA family protein [Halorubellus sp. JP-L1]
MRRERVASGTPWEDAVGYSRAIRAGDEVHVSGTTATDDDGDLVGADDPAAQMQQALSNVADALERAGASIDDVVRTRIYVVDIEDWEAIGAVHADVFEDVRPATSMGQVERLVDPEMLVEVEAVAIVDGHDADGEADSPGE